MAGSPALPLGDSQHPQDFELLHELGRGGFAVVYAARYRSTGASVAVKLMDRHKVVEHNLASRVQNEVAIHHAVRHPNIIPLVDFFETAEHIWLVMQLAEAGTLEELILSHPPFTLQQAQPIMRQLTDAVKYLHNNGIAHRDLTASNVLLTYESPAGASSSQGYGRVEHLTVKLADFGLAVQLPGLQARQYTMCGTANFLSPEVASRAPHGLETDLWALGCLLYTLFVRKPPFQGSQVPETLESVVSGAYTIPDHVPPSARDLIEMLLQRNPADRPSLQQVLAHPFFTAPRPTRQPRQPRRHTAAPRDSSFQTTTTTRSVGTSQSSFPALPRRGGARLPHIDTRRLPPTTHSCKAATVSLESDGTVVLVLKRSKLRMVIAQDGQRVEVRSRRSNGAASCTSCLASDLPKRLQDKYCYAAYFVDAIRRKTPKLTLWTDLARCVLFENQDVDVRFFSGYRTVLTGQRTQVVDPRGRSTAFSTSLDECDALPVPEASELGRVLRHVREQKARLLGVQRQRLHSLGNAGFPHVIGRRPPEYSSFASDSTASRRQFGPKAAASVASSERTSARAGALSEPRAPSSAVTATRASKPPQRGLEPALDLTAVRIGFLDTVGWGLLLSDGRTWVLGVDGVQSILPPDVRHIDVVDAQGTKHRHDLHPKSRWELPAAVLARLGDVSTMIAYLQRLSRADQQALPQ